LKEGLGSSILDTTSARLVNLAIDGCAIV
jgi:hypothetical protein